MDNHLFSVIEYQKIKKELKKEIYTYPGKYFLEEMNPLTDMQDVILSQKTTSEMKNIFELESELPFTRLLDIERYLKESKIKGGILKARQLLDIARVLECLFLIKNFFTKVSPEKYSLIRKYISNIKVFRSLEKEIKTCINDDGEIVDNASSTLKRIRQQTRNAESRIRDKLENMIRDPINRTFIQDEIITIRQGRFVLPIKQQEKSKFPGIVQDKSESGVTVFIEPLPIVELNNELRELSHEEKKELYKILQNLTNLVGKNYEDILSSYKILGQLDLINAKARLSIKMHGIEPKINNQGIIKLKQARHPFLKDSAVPIDIELGNDFNILVITGPNTGGKTVTLKTVGLLQLMVQSGMHIPANIDSEVSVFKKIFADIGDEQSIEQSLSTFSSHLKQITQILELADKDTLILLDELGAGTDPSEGSALSMAILDYLKLRESKVLSTTHYDSIKAYAYLTKNVMNARVEFDEVTLQPTYEVSIGLPGKSCAFSIAKRLGLPFEIIQDAQKYLKKEKIDLENLIKKMEIDRQIMADNLELIENEKQNIENMRKELETKINNLEKSKNNIFMQAYQEADNIVISTQKRAKEIINSLKISNYKNPKTLPVKNELNKIGTEIKNKIKKLSQTDSNNLGFNEGDYVLIKSINKEGFILEKNEKKNLYLVQIDNFKLSVPFNDVEKTNKRDEQDYKDLIKLSQKDRLEKKAKFSNEIHVRHMTAAEAQTVLEKYLDDAFLLNVSPVYIVHGKGKGILRERVALLLRELNYVKSYRRGDYHEGGEGVTVVYF